jgi:hypothetical protein
MSATASRLRSVGLEGGATEDGWEYRYWSEQNEPFFFRREGDTLTLRATHKKALAWVPIVPVVVRFEEKWIETFAYFDTGTVQTYAPPSLVESFGISVGSLLHGGTMNGSQAWRHFSGTVVLCDGSTMLEGFGVMEQEPPPAVHEWGAAFILGLDALSHFDASFEGWGRGDESPPTFTLTPR